MIDVQIEAKLVAKKFNKEWIFRDLNFSLNTGNAYAIIGKNGSGKSTLLQCIAGNMPLTKGEIVTRINGKVETETWKQIAISAPYLELIEEFTLTEFLRFHHQFKPFKNELKVEEVIEKSKLSDARNKLLKNFSSGMKQRVKLALCLFSQNPILFFDEPTTNLDKVGFDWYQENILTETSQKLVIICSNQPDEYHFTKNLIQIDS